MNLPGLEREAAIKNPPLPRHGQCLSQPRSGTVLLTGVTGGARAVSLDELRAFEIKDALIANLAFKGQTKLLRRKKINFLLL